MGKKWTIETYALHNEAIRVLDEKFQNERDRRYTEVNVEKEKALKIKETADLTALELARESQVYKDERNDAMREQNLKETGHYATHNDVAEVVEALGNKLSVILKPLIEHVSNEQGKEKGMELTTGKIFGYIASLGVILGIIFALLKYVIK